MTESDIELVKYFDTPRTVYDLISDKQVSLRTARRIIARLSENHSIKFHGYDMKQTQYISTASPNTKQGPLPIEVKLTTGKITREASMTLFWNFTCPESTLHHVAKRLMGIVVTLWARSHMKEQKPDHEFIPQSDPANLRQQLIRIKEDYESVLNSIHQLLQLPVWDDSDKVHIKLGGWIEEFDEYHQFWLAYYVRNEKPYPTNIWVQKTLDE